MGAVTLMIDAMPNGGFVVSEPAERPAEFNRMCLAASTLEEALDYVRKRFRPEREAAPVPAAQDPRITGILAVGQNANPSMDTSDIVRASYDHMRAAAADQGALSRQAMTSAVNRRAGNTWRV
jgi:hypothetical protein